MNIYLKIYLDRNFGDDLMLYKFVGYFFYATIYVHCENHMLDFYSELLFKFKNVKLIECPLREIDAYGNGFFDYIVLLGGSTLQGNRYMGCWYRFLNCRLIKKQKQFGTKYAIIGCNTGPFKNKITKYFVKKELRCAEIVTTRDKNSFELISFSTNISEIYYYPDILFDLSEKHSTCEGKKGLAISVYGPETDNTVTFLAQLCDCYIKKTGENVKLICFDIGKENDVQAADAVYALSGQKEKIDIIKHEPTCEQIISSIGSSRIVLAIRFHAAILAASLGIPFLTMSYSNKMRNFMKDINKADKDTPINIVSTLSPNDYLHELLNNPVYPINEWGENCNNHFIVLSDFINRNRRSS